MRTIPSSTADLVFLDPPFNLKKTYGEVSDSRPEREYELWLQSVVGEAIRMLSDGGALYIYHMPRWALRLAGLLERHLMFRHWIAVSMKNGFARGNHLYPAHYALLYFTRGTPNHFERPKLKPAICRKCGATVRDYGGYRSIIEEKGVNVSDIWDDLSPVRHASRKRRPANELPIAMTNRIVAISGYPGGTFVDPFAGSGAAVASAAAAGMRFFACDIVKANCVLIEHRLKSLTHPHQRKRADVTSR
jgi:site-specific DNA-methyltransferase (adenine-specific)